jgi:hypothetical protein
MRVEQRDARSTRARVIKRMETPGSARLDAKHTTPISATTVIAQRTACSRLSLTRWVCTVTRPPKTNSGVPSHRLGRSPMQTAQCFPNLDCNRTTPANGATRIRGTWISNSISALTATMSSTYISAHRSFIASRFGNLLPPVDSVSTTLDDAAQITHDTIRAKRPGFGAKVCIHPRQVAAVDAVFIPREQGVEWARRVVEGATASQGAAVAVDGRMVDRPVILKAQELWPGPGDVCRLAPDSISTGDESHATV